MTFGAINKYDICWLVFQSLLPKSEESDIASTFSKVVLDKKRNIDKLYERKVGRKMLRNTRKQIERKSVRDTENYVPYHSSDKNTEEGLAINSFERQAQQAELSISSQTTKEAIYYPGQKKWDRIRKKMVSVENPKNNKIRTESGIWIPATYKTGRYADWKEKTKTEDMIHQEMGLEGDIRHICIIVLLSMVHVAYQCIKVLEAFAYFVFVCCFFCSFP